jgi:putative transposase
LTLERLPPYAPELNPVEYLWTHLKYGQLPNFAPKNVFELDETLRDHLGDTTLSSKRLRSFCDHCRLPFDWG